MPNTLIVGANKAPILQHLPERFLFIDDGPLIAKLDRRPDQITTVLDLERHTLNPLKDMTYRRAREFVDVLNAVFPEGENTLTKRNSDFILLEALLDKPRFLDKLIKDTKETHDAYQKIQTLLLSPVLESVLNKQTNMSLKGTVIARLDRAELGDFDAFVLANMLISAYDGPVVLPDFGFYATRFHRGLMRQGRLIAGISSFDELPDMRTALLAIEHKEASRCIPDDAALLAQYAGIPTNSNAYADFIHASIR